MNRNGGAQLLCDSASFAVDEAVLLLCFPGAVCEAFVGVMGIVSVLNLRIPYPFNVLLLLVMALFFASAISTAIFSFILYLKRPLRRKPWFVYLNLAVNLSGMLFCAAEVVYGLINGFGPDWRIDIPCDEKAEDFTKTHDPRIRLCEIRHDFLANNLPPS